GRSASAYTATLVIPASRHARITRTAISPRFAIRTLDSGVVSGTALLVDFGWTRRAGFDAYFRSDSRVPQPGAVSRAGYRRVKHPATSLGGLVQHQYFTRQKH